MSDDGDALANLLLLLFCNAPVTYNCNRRTINPRMMMMMMMMMMINVLVVLVVHTVLTTSHPYFKRFQLE